MFRVKIVAFSSNLKKARRAKCLELENNTERTQTEDLRLLKEAGDHSEKS